MATALVQVRSSSLDFATSVCTPLSFQHRQGSGMSFKSEVTVYSLGNELPTKILSSGRASGYNPLPDLFPRSEESRQIISGQDLLQYVSHPASCRSSAKSRLLKKYDLESSTQDCRPDSDIVNQAREKLEQFQIQSGQSNFINAVTNSCSVTSANLLKSRSPSRDSGISNDDVCSRSNQVNPEGQLTVFQDDKGRSGLDADEYLKNIRPHSRKKRLKSSKSRKSTKLRKKGNVRVRKTPTSAGNTSPLNLGVYCKHMKVLPSYKPTQTTRPVQTEGTFTKINNLRTLGQAGVLYSKPPVSFRSQNVVSFSLGNSLKGVSTGAGLTVPQSVVTSPRTSPHQSSVGSEMFGRVTKIYLSDRQSGMLHAQGGIDLPCAPPATPTPEHLKFYDYVPSMSDIRSQRAVKVRLECLDKVARKKKEAKKHEKLKLEKEQVKDSEKKRKCRQRQEIYALNKVMTQFEYGNFAEFCRKQGIDGPLC